jgi:hypothetical protein
MGDFERVKSFAVSGACVCLALLVASVALAFEVHPFTDAGANYHPSLNVP